MSHEKSEHKPHLSEEYVRDEVVKDMVGIILQLREIAPNDIPRGIKVLRKLPVNQTMPFAEREEELERNNRLYYEILHDPRLAEQGIRPDMETMVDAEISMEKGGFHMSSIRLGDEASLVRMTVHNDEGEPTEFRAQLWYPAVSSEEWMFDKVQKQD